MIGAKLQTAAICSACIRTYIDYAKNRGILFRNSTDRAALMLGTATAITSSMRCPLTTNIMQQKGDECACLLAAATSAAVAALLL